MAMLCLLSIFCHMFDVSIVVKVNVNIVVQFGISTVLYYLSQYILWRTLMFGNVVYSTTCLKRSLKNRQNKGLKDRW